MKYKNVKSPPQKEMAEKNRKAKQRKEKKEICPEEWKDRKENRTEQKCSQLSGN